jgi:mannose-6-phosphate isomerase-like protein (cupin superfamily)
MFQTTLRTVALTAPLLTAPAWADEGFSNRDFKGDYAFHLDGVLTSPGAPVVAAYNAAVGRFTADGAGNITEGTRSVSANGTIFEEAFTCTYNINSDGTGKATCNFSVFGTSTLDIVLRDDGDEFYFNVTSMPSTNGKPVLQGVGRRQSPTLGHGASAAPFVFPVVTPDPNPFIVHGTGGELFTFLKTAATTDGRYSLGDAVFTTGPLPHIHHREDEWFYVVSGQVAIEMGDYVYSDITQVPGANLPKETMHRIIAGPGTLVWAPRYHLHAFHSADGKPAEMYVVMAPGGLDQFFANTEGKSPEEQSQIALDYGFNLSVNPSQYVAGIDYKFMMHDNHASELLALLAATPGEGFTNHDFKGDYVFRLNGVLTSPTASVVTAYDAAIGRFTSDGAGNITQGIRSVSANGTIAEETFTCTYNVNPDGTGRATCDFSVFGTSTLDIVLRDDGDEFYFSVTGMPSTSGKPVLQGLGRWQSPRLKSDRRLNPANHAAQERPDEPAPLYCRSRGLPST